VLPIFLFFRYSSSGSPLTSVRLLSLACQPVRRWFNRCPRLSRISVLVLACSFFASSSGWAQELQAVVVQGANSSGPGLSGTLANAYTIGAPDISSLPRGETTNITDVLAQMPGVAIDQNQQIHIRNTEGPQFQYQIDGVMVPFDINTNPPFISMINPMFIKQLSLLDAILPSRYSYATGGVVDIETKDGSEQPGGSVSLTFGQRDTLEPSAQYAGSVGKFSYYVSALYDEGNTAFSPATSGPNPIHNWTNQGQAFGVFTYAFDADTKLSLILSAAASNNQLPNVPNLTPAFSLNNVRPFNSANIDSDLNFRDYLAILSLKSAPSSDFAYQISYSLHSISQQFRPDNAGELIYQGVASTASHVDFDNTLQGDLTYQLGSHTLGAGFYFGEYRVIAEDSSLVFPADANGNQTSDVPIRINANTSATNFVGGIYVNDLWQITNQLRVNAGIRWDVLTGFTRSSQFDPTINISYEPFSGTTLHAGFARYMQVPSFQGIAPEASKAFAGTTGEAGPAGTVNPVTEDDYEFDIGIIQRVTPAITISEDNFYEITRHYLDTGQFGTVPIFAPFNYGHGHIYGVEVAATYKARDLSIYANLTFGKNLQTGVRTGQFNFDPDELAYINHHFIVLDHQPIVGISAGASYTWKPYSFSVDAVYSSGLRGGFADTDQLPAVFQINVSAQRSFKIPGLGELIDRITILNLVDRTNLIRPAEGIGIFQSAYGPRFTILDTVTFAF
jgi:outer membrane receptor for ferrienterochelin and colicin